MASLPSDLPPLDVAPGPVRADPLTSDRPVRWGILATGKIAHAFVNDLAVLDECETVAVGSRRQESADAFAETHAIPAAYGDYRAMLEDPAVDVVYVASPHAMHREHVELAFEAGKAVLCEKPLTLNAAESELLVAAAREKRLFFMEAMWMRCIPLIRRLQQLATAGALGEVRQVRADLGFVVDKPPTDRLLDPALGAGALLDMGIYPLTFADLFLGQPIEVAAAASLSSVGADLDVSMSFGHAGGATSSLSTSMTAWSPRTASIATNRGRIDLAAPFHHPTTATWTSYDMAPGFGGPARVEEISEPMLGRGYAHEALEVVRCLRRGEIESPLIPLDGTVAMMRLMDRIRKQIGVSYAADHASRSAG